MPLSQTERPAYYEDQYLDAADLTAAVDYARIQHARHLLGGHTWGIGMGLDLRETLEPGGRVSIRVLPGYAWDGYGRPIVVSSPYRIPEEQFASFTQIDPAGKGLLVPIWLAYYESSSGRDAFFDQCARDVSYSTNASYLSNASYLGRASYLGNASYSNSACLSNASSLSNAPYARVRETFRVEVGEMSAGEFTSGINIAGRSLIDPRTALREFDPSAPLIYDQTVPHQEYSSVSTRARWLIPIGFVRWLPVLNQPGHFVLRDESEPEKDSDKIRRVRRYAGLVAAEIGAADNVIRLRNRGRDPVTNSFRRLVGGQTDDVVVRVEGQLFVEGNGSYDGGYLAFRGQAGDDFGTPMLIRRNDAVATARALQVSIGPPDEGANRFAVGTEDAGGFETLFSVVSGGNVGIGTKDPVDKLDVAGDLRISGLSRKPGGGSWTSSSDIRLKKEVTPLTDALEKVLQLQGFSFEWKEPEKMGDLKGPQMGLVAQDVEKVFPGWVSEDTEGYRELTVRGFEALAIEAIRELKATVDELKIRISELETAKPKKQSKSKDSKSPAAK